MTPYLKSEFLKLIYNKWALIVMTGTVIFIPLMASTLGSFFGETGAELIRSKLLQSLYLGQTGYAVLAGLYFGREYTGSALRTSLLAGPVRMKLLAAKFTVLLSAALTVFILSTLFSIPLTGYNEGAAKLAELIFPAFISTLEILIITSATVLITKSMIAAVAIPLSLILGLGSLLLQYGQIFRYIPVISSMNAFFIREVPAYPGAAAGLIFQGICCLVLTALGCILFMRRAVR